MSDLGQLLQQARAYKGVSLREAERATRISRQYLSALEVGDFAQLPPSAYARGIVRNYAQYLGLDPTTALGLYEAQVGGERRKSEIELLPATSRLDIQSHWAPNFAIIFFMIAISAIVFAWMYSAYIKPAESLPTQTVLGVATVTPVDESIMSVVPTPTATVPTVTAAGGGFATVTPSVTATVAAQDTPTEQADAESADVAETPSQDSESEPTAEAPACGGAMGEGPHTFVVWVTQELWVEVTLDGETVLSDILPADCERIFYGESAVITTGNAEFAHVYVDGDELPPPDAWNGSYSWP